MPRATGVSAWFGLYGKGVNSGRGRSAPPDLAAHVGDGLHVPVAPVLKRAESVAQLDDANEVRYRRPHGVSIHRALLAAGEFGPARLPTQDVEAPAEFDAIPMEGAFVAASGLRLGHSAFASLQRG